MTVVWINTKTAVRGLFVALFCSARALAAPAVLQAPGEGLAPANQLVVSGNACGPTALLNAFRFGSKDWQRAYQAVGGSTDKERIYWLIRESGMRPSKHLVGRARWSRRGVNIADLCDMANETAAGQYLPQLSQHVYFSQPGEGGEKLLMRVHRDLTNSMKKGFPPVLSLRRYAHRRVDGKLEWVVLDAHFVTLMSLPAKLDSSASSFRVGYADPWGGRLVSGEISIPRRAVLADDVSHSPCLEAGFPDSAVGRKLVRAGETTVLTLSAALGRW